MIRQPALALVAADAPQVVTRPTLFAMGFPAPDPASFATVAQAAAAIRAAIAGRPFDLRLGRAAFPGFADFPQVSVRCGGLILAVLGGPWTSASALSAARVELAQALAVPA